MVRLFIAVGFLFLLSWKGDNGSATSAFLIQRGHSRSSFHPVDATTSSAILSSRSSCRDDTDGFLSNQIRRKRQSARYLFLSTNEFTTSIDKKNPCDDDDEEGKVREDTISSTTRRTILTNSMIFSSCAVSSSLLLLPDISKATTETDATIALQPDFNCLQDLLPPLDQEKNVRLFLCRHGQTENNRLRKVQGARVDAPINENGMLQATNMGKALARAMSPSSGGGGPLFFASELQRAQQTAQLAAAQQQVHRKGKTPVTILSSLNEIDFGPVAESQSVEAATAGMAATYAAWAAGKLDVRPNSSSKVGSSICGGVDDEASQRDCRGENAIEIFQRASESISFLTKAAEEQSPNGCVVAVTHSSFLRILIGWLLKESMVESGIRKLPNCSITVLDVPKRAAANAGSGNTSSTATSKVLKSRRVDNKDEPPLANVLVVGEGRHLPVVLPL